MKTDRELLELAAKAAALPLEWRTGRDGTDVPRSWVLGKEWNPADDDGDALRLEVKLNLQVNPEIQTDHGPAATAYDGGYGIATEPHNGDPCAATRMAVLRAAAAIGEAMP